MSYCERCGEPSGGHYPECHVRCEEDVEHVTKELKVALDRAERAEAALDTLREIRRVAIRAFVRAGQPWPLSDAFLDGIEKP